MPNLSKTFKGQNRTNKSYSNPSTVELTRCHGHHPLGWTNYIWPRNRTFVEVASMVVSGLFCPVDLLMNSGGLLSITISFFFQKVIEVGIGQGQDNKEIFKSYGPGLVMEKGKNIMHH